MKKFFHTIMIIVSGLGFSGLFAHAVYSQQRFSPGYVILNHEDTLYGLVRDRNSSGDKIYNKIRFLGGQARKKKYSPQQILGYKTGDSEFDSKWFLEDARFFRFDYYCREGAGEKVFLKVLERGPLTCYFREFLDPESGYLEGYELFLRQGEDYYERATQGIFGLKKKRLSIYFADCPSLVERINNGEIKDPLEVVEFYNKRCADE